MKKNNSLRYGSWIRVVLLICISFLTLSCHKDVRSDNVLIGSWIGAIDKDVHVFYNISRKLDGSLMGYNGIIEFRLSGLPVEVVTLRNDTVRFQELESNQKYEGVLNRDSLTIRGKYTNLNINASWPLNLRLVDSLPAPRRPQTPRKPYSYYEEEVVYKNKAAGIDIAGTLTMPDKKGPFPAVLLISGSGQQNRDDESSFHHRFMVIADHLTKKGIAVLRVDDRGIGGTTRKGPFFNSTTKDFEGDVLAGVQYLRARKEIDPGKVGLIGHSEGGLIASMAAAESPDIAFIVLMASPAGGKFSDGIIRQDSVQARAKGADDKETVTMVNWCKRFYQIVLNEENRDVARAEMKKLYDERSVDEKKAFERTGLGGGTLDIDYALTPHFRYFMTLNPDDFLKQIRCPVLAMMGDKDISGTSKPTLNAIKMSLDSNGNSNYRIEEFCNLNHGFQDITKANNGDIEETISPDVLDIMATWIREQCKLNL